jgi:hypothetical protein
LECTPILSDQEIGALRVESPMTKVGGLPLEIGARSFVGHWDLVIGHSVRVSLVILPNSSLSTTNPTPPMTVVLLGS